ncbi:AtpZ/AtpI family protein [Sulfurimonas sp. MAG313]|nr:AtpZ/AtpI family protein [Sulfurimonas sp. MAG313]MDF1881008.1 AtpZ/AtpI family protein [Sulfurimonas sp. MAG313]
MAEIEDKAPRIKPIIEGIDSLSLGVSIVVAILMGVGIGIGLQKLFDVKWVLWIGVFVGVSAAGLNIFKAYKKQLREFEELKKNNPRYQDQKALYGDEDDD